MTTVVIKRRKSSNEFISKLQECYIKKDQFVLIVSGFETLLKKIIRIAYVYIF